MKIGIVFMPIRIRIRIGINMEIRIWIGALAKERLGSLIKKKTKFSSYIRIQMGSVAKSYMRKGFLIYEEMGKYLTIYEEAVSHI
jgi:hypothetical protein